MTKFRVLETEKQEAKKKTVFTHYLTGHKVAIEADNCDIKDYAVVTWLGGGLYYRDVFLVGYNEDDDHFNILFGEKGSEFDNL